MRQQIWFLPAFLCICVWVAAEDKRPELEKQGGLKGDVELLRTVAHAHEANSDRIKTWRGQATIEVQIHQEGDSSIERWIKSSVTFAYDSARVATRWNHAEEDDRGVIDGEDTSMDKKYFRSGMVRDGVFYHLDYDQSKSQDRRTIYIRPASKASHWTHPEDFDPMWYLTKGGENIKKRLLFYYREANNPRLSPGTVERDGDKVILETRSGNVVNRYKFDLSLGGNLISYFGSDSSVTGRYYWTYEKHKDVWIPMTFTYINVAKYESGMWRNTIRRIEFTDNVVNEPLGKDEFSFAKMGLRLGDSINDGRTHIEYIFGQPGATEADLPPKLIESIAGEPLPPTEEFDLRPDVGAIRDKKILVCFFDMQQRPSRHMVRELAKSTQQLKESDTEVFCIHASRVSRKELDEWIKENDVSFSVGIVKGDEKKMRLDWGVKSLPWLILTDKKHIVQAEGFGLGELDDRTESMK